MVSYRMPTVVLIALIFFFGCAPILKDQLPDSGGVSSVDNPAAEDDLASISELGMRESSSGDVSEARDASITPFPTHTKDLAAEIERELKVLKEKELLLLEDEKSESSTCSTEVQYDIPITINNRVENYIDYFQSRGKKAFGTWLSRSTRYKDLMQGILREYGLPEDLFYLAMIESGFNMKAYSRRHAAGPWQFISRTGRKYGLTVTRYLDERLDPIKSTHAAAQYLRDLYAEFGCWYLAMAGYNAGEGKVDRAIRKYKTKEFWKLCEYKYLKRETKNYVPKVLAAAIIAKQPEKYGFSTINYLAAIAYDEIEVKGPLSLKKLANSSNTSYRELLLLNPELKKKVVPKLRRKYTLKIPVNRKEVILASVKELAKHPMSEGEFIRHKVRRGESLHIIAHKYGTSVKSIAELNSISRPSRIKAGKVLLVDARRGVTHGGGNSPKKTRKYASKKRVKDSRASSQGRFVHTVQRGDSLWELSKTYGVHWKDFYKWNKIDHHRGLKPGQKLIVYTGNSENASEVNADRITEDSSSGPPDGNNDQQRIIHKVRKGDTLWKLSKTYGVYWKDFYKWNKIDHHRGLRPGQKLIVYLGKKGNEPVLNSDRISEDSSSGSLTGNDDQERIIYKVRKGDTLWKLSRRYGVHWKDFYKWNTIRHHRGIKPGDKLTIYVNKET